MRLVHRGACELYLARPTDADSGPSVDYVLKKLPAEREDSPCFVGAFRREVEASRSVSHPHLIPVLDAHTRRPPYFLVMPRLEGVRLSVLIQEGQCPRRRALRVARHVAGALESLHAAGWWHGDVKPDNIMVAPQGHATLIDLGLAVRSGGERPAGATPRYAAPELLDPSTHDRCGPASDLYGLGMCLLEMLGGPWCEVGQPGVGGLQRSPSAMLLSRLLATHPDDRPTAREAAEELSRLEIDELARLAG